jgi:hypothetical protein
MALDRQQLYLNFKNKAKELNKETEFNSVYPDINTWVRIRFKNEINTEITFNNSKTNNIITNDWTIKQFYQKYACDLEWAKELEYCKSNTTTTTTTVNPDPAPNLTDVPRIFWEKITDAALVEKLKAAGKKVWQEGGELYRDFRDRLSNWYEDMTTLPDWAENQTCLNDAGGVNRSDSDDKVQVRTQDGEDYLYFYKSGKFIYENKVKDILNGTWKCVSGKLYIKTDDGYEFTKKDGWVKQGTSSSGSSSSSSTNTSTTTEPTRPSWTNEYLCLKGFVDMIPTTQTNKISFKSTSGKDSLNFYKNLKFIYEYENGSISNGTWKCENGEMVINTEDGSRYTSSKGWTKVNKVKPDEFNPNISDDSEF